MMILRCALVAVCVVLAGCGTSIAGQPTGSSPWPSPGTDLAESPEARPAGEPPEFPSRVDGYELAGEWRSIERAFESADWTTIYEFPATMNGCVRQRFYVRWRAANPDAVVEATMVSTGVIVLVEPAAGAVGWMSGSGCAQPAFRMQDSAGESTLTDVFVEVQQWKGAV